MVQLSLETRNDSITRVVRTFSSPRPAQSGPSSKFRCKFLPSTLQIGCPSTCKFTYLPTRLSGQPGTSYQPSDLIQPPCLPTIQTDQPTKLLEICILRSASSSESDNSCLCRWNLAFLGSQCCHHTQQRPSSHADCFRRSAPITVFQCRTAPTVQDSQHVS